VSVAVTERIDLMDGRCDTMEDNHDELRKNVGKTDRCSGLSFPIVVGSYIGIGMAAGDGGSPAGEPNRDTAA
jgi:hypothetical protein